MGMMPLCINIFFHAFQPSVYSILFNSDSQTNYASPSPQEENDQAFFIAL